MELRPPAPSTGSRGARAAEAGPGALEPATLRQLVLLVSAVILVSDLFYAAISPLLPYYVDRFGLSTASAGVLTGSFGAGVLVASLPAGRLSARFGPRAMLIAGLVLITSMSLLFGLGLSVVVLDIARFGQGIGSAVAWTGGMAWVSSAAPAERRGALLGSVSAAAAAGAVLGPVLGAAGRTFGPGVVFGGVALLAAVLLIALVRLPAPAVAAEPAVGGLRSALVQPAIRQGIVLLGSIAMVRGMLDLLLPLRLDAVGASSMAIAAVFIAAAASQLVSSPIAGRYADAGGWQTSVRAGLYGGAVLVLAVPWINDYLVLAVLGALAGPASALIWPSALMRLSHGAEEARIDHAYGLGLASIAWAAGQALATTGGGWVATTWSDVVATCVVAGLVAVAATGVLASARANDRVKDIARPTCDPT